MASQEFRHTVQESGESVATYICRLERAFRVAYGRDGLTSETRDAFLHAQLHEGLRYEIAKGSAVSSAHTYKSLCIAAKHEEHRLEELRKRQQYRKPIGSAGDNHPPRRPSFTKPPSEKSNPMIGNKKCYICDKPGHFANQCRSNKSESPGVKKPGDKPAAKQVSAGQDVTSQAKEEVKQDSLDLLLSSSDEEAVKLVRVVDKGSRPHTAKILIQGVPRHH